MHQQDLDSVASPARGVWGKRVSEVRGGDGSHRAGRGGPRCSNLQLCPKCYLVTWTDQDGLHLRQGVPMGKAVDQATLGKATLQSGEPESC